MLVRELVGFLEPSRDTILSLRFPAQALRRIVSADHACAAAPDAVRHLASPPYWHLRRRACFMKLVAGRRRSRRPLHSAQRFMEIPLNWNLSRQYMPMVHIAHPLRGGFRWLDMVNNKTVSPHLWRFWRFALCLLRKVRRFGAD